MTDTSTEKPTWDGGETLAAWELGCLLHGAKGIDEIACPW